MAKFLILNFPNGLIIDTNENNTPSARNWPHNSELLLYFCSNFQLLAPEVENCCSEMNKTIKPHGGTKSLNTFGVTYFKTFLILCLLIYCSLNSELNNVEGVRSVAC